jgi:hypothetical protein
VISSLHGSLPLTIEPEEELPVSMRGRLQICRVRGTALGQRLDFQVSLDVKTGEFLLMSPDTFVGSFRLGDLIVAQATQMVARAQRERSLEAPHAKAH